MLMDKILLIYYKLISKVVVLPKGSHTPILYDDYSSDLYYYMINNNKNQIYSLDEMYEIMKKDVLIDPFTRMPVNSWCFVKVLISK